MTLRRSLFACVIALAALLPAVARAQIPGTANIQINGTNIIGGTSGRCLFDNAGKVGETASCGLAGGVTVGTSLITSGTNGRILYDNSGVLGELAPGQLPATATNDSAAAGKVGEVISSGNCLNGSVSATVTITIATPGVVTWTGHTMTGACPVTFTTSGALPTGITAGTPYWVVPSSVTANTFQIATSIANAVAGTSVATSGTQSGTQTGTGARSLTNATVADLTGVSLTAGDWDCRGAANINPAGSTTQSQIIAWISATSATIPSGQNLGAILILNTAFTTGAAQVLPLGVLQVSVNATTTVYVSADVFFGVSTNTGTGSLTCRRSR